MYKIALRNGSPVNVGQMMEVPMDGTLTPGVLACIVDGQAKAMTLGLCPDALVSDVNDTRATVMLLTEDIILEAPAYGTSFTNITGKFVQGESEQVSLTEGAYCQVIDALDAKKNGDKILVRFVRDTHNV